MPLILQSAVTSVQSVSRVLCYKCELRYLCDLVPVQQRAGPRHHRTTVPSVQENISETRRLERNLLDGVPEVLALESGELELERRGRARAISAREGACAPWRAAADLAEVSELREGRGVAERDEDDAVVG